MSKLDLEWFRNKKIFLTGHTGFKGSWLCKILTNAGAKVIGYSLQPVSGASLYEYCEIDKRVKTVFGDIRDREKLICAITEEQPQIVIHLAAQPIVRESYNNPVYTFETNVMGTVNVCEAVRLNACVKSFLNVTTDKVYENKEWKWGYREIDPLDGYDPYSNSKSCSELVTHCYINSFFKEKEIAASTARAGNVIGGGDFARDRIIPDCARAAMAGQDIVVRNPYSIRPYQHVLEPLFFYLLLVQKQYNDRSKAGFYNIGPDESDYVTTGELVDMFCANWQEEISWINQNEGGPHEAGFLKLDCSKAKFNLGWKPVWDIEKAIEKTVEWYKVFEHQGNVAECMDMQILEFVNGR